MRRLLCGLLMMLASISAAAAGIRSYDVVLAVADGGAAKGTARIAIDDARPETITIPLGFVVSDARLTAAPAGVRLTTEAGDRQTRLRLQLPSQTPAAVDVEIAFTVAKALTIPEPAAGQKRVLPEGAYMLRHALVATEPIAIRTYRCSVTFPPSLRAHAIREALPKQGKKEAEPRVRLGSIGGEAGATLQAGALRQGDVASMQIELVPRSHSPLWIVAGVLLSAVYLVRFRDLVTGRPPNEENRSKP